MLPLFNIIFTVLQTMVTLVLGFLAILVGYFFFLFIHSVLLKGGLILIVKN